ncbi:MAG: SDR family oxidoreductase [Chloroflexi bacterium]|nr:SDR family oxidoreductase [Chloroflexota bacterium]
MKALVTGGAGFIGSNIVQLLLEKNHQVVVLDNLSSGYRSNLAPFPDILFIQGDIRDQDALASAVEGVDVVFHLAASVGNKRSIDHPIEDAEINVIGTLRLLEAMRRAGIPKIVNTSSAGIFGELKTLPIAENHPIDPDSPYGVSKLAAEKDALAYSKLYGIEVVSLRYFNVYGVNQRFDAYGNVIPIFAHRMLHGETVTVFGDGEQTRDFVNVRDVASANYCAAITKGVGGVYNIASGTSISINGLIELMQDVSGIQPTVDYGPPRAGDVRHSLADISAARAAFGYQPTVELRAGLDEYMKWFAEEAKRS